MGVIKYTKDKLSNLVANLGTSRDKASHNEYGLPIIDDNQLLNAYRGAWIPRKIVDIPALDACRNWRNWQADKDQISKIEMLEKQLKLQQKVKSALTKARLFGGAAIYIGTSDADPTKPINENAKIKHLTVLTKRQLTPSQLETDPDSERFNQPAYYTLANTAQEIHPSRLVIFLGGELPDEELVGGAELGWGDSVLLPAFEAVKQADSTTANVASLIFEAQVDVIKIPGFMDGLADKEYEQLVLERLTLAARAKGINGALLLDSEEDYEQKSANLSNLKDIIYSFMQNVSGAADIPMTRFFGQSPGGLQSSGDSDLRNYYDRVRSTQELDIEPAMEVLDKLIIRNAIGSNPDDVWYQWAPLWQPTASEQAEIGVKTADMISKIALTNLIPEDALSKAASNALIERGVMPGLEQALDDVDLEDPETDDESLSGA